MYSLPIIATSIVLFSTTILALDNSGNLDFCIPKDGSSGNVFLDVSDERLCVESVNGIVQISTRSAHETAVQWHYENGLLRASNGLCLGQDPISQSELVLQECPNDEIEEHHHYDPSWIKADSNHMRFIITAEGRIQLLSDVVTLESKASSLPHCMTMAKKEGDELQKPYLIPCEGDDNIENDFSEEHQIFDVSGTYSGSFLMPLRRTWSTEEPVKLAYQIGLPSRADKVDDDVTNFVEITTLYPGQGKDLETRILDVITLEESSGIVSIASFGSNLDGFAYQISGKISATLRTTEGDVDDGDNDGNGLILDEASFVVIKHVQVPGVQVKRSYMVYIYTAGCLIACFLLSVLAEKFLAKQLRSEGDGSNDGKTVCLSVDDDEEEKEQDEFPLDDNVEAGFGVIHICVDKDSTSDTETDMDIDESRNSTMVAIPPENEV